MVYHVAVVGSGPAGLTAGIYTSRAKLSTVIIEGDLPGGQLTTTTKVENWPGIVSVFGVDLMMDMRKQAEVCGSTFVQDVIASVDFSQTPYTLVTRGGAKIQAHAIIIATGSSHKKLGCKGEAEYFSKGVATCATCDAPFYSGKDVIIVGGGNTAVTEAEHLLKFAKTVTIVHILDQLTATDAIKDKVLEHPNTKVIYNATIKEIVGDGQHVTGVTIEDQKDKSTRSLKADGVFVAIGFTPNTSFVGSQLEIDKFGYLVLKDKTKTSKPGIFAAGDVADYTYRQAVTSAGMGCMAALDCQTYLAQVLHG